MVEASWSFLKEGVEIKDNYLVEKSVELERDGLTLINNDTDKLNQIGMLNKITITLNSLSGNGWNNNGSSTFEYSCGLKLKNGLEYRTDKQEIMCSTTKYHHEKTFTINDPILYSGSQLDWESLKIYCKCTKKSTTSSPSGLPFRKVNNEPKAIITYYGEEGIIKYYTGSTWQNCSVHYFNGSKWIQTQPYYFENGEWKPTGS